MSRPAASTASFSSNPSSSRSNSTPFTSFYISDSPLPNKRKQLSNGKSSTFNKRKLQENVSVFIPHQSDLPRCPPLLKATNSKTQQKKEYHRNVVDSDSDFVPIESSSGDDEDSKQESQRKKSQLSHFKQTKLEEEQTAVVLPMVYKRFKPYFSCLKSVSYGSLESIHNLDNKVHESLSSPSSIQFDNIIADDHIHWVDPRWRVSKNGEDFYQSVKIQNHLIKIDSVVSCERKTGHEFSYKKSRLKCSTDQNYGSDTQEEDEEDDDSNDLNEDEKDPALVNRPVPHDQKQCIDQLDPPVYHFNGRVKKTGRPNLRRFQVRALFERDGVKYFHGVWLEEASHSFLSLSAEPNELLLVDKCYEIPLNFVTAIVRVDFISADQRVTPPKQDLYCRFHWKPTEGSFTDLPRFPKLKLPNPIEGSASVCPICLTIPKEIEWLTDPKTGQVLLGQTDQYELLGFKLRGGEIYRLHDFVRVSGSTSSSTSSPELHLIGQIIEICGIRANPNASKTIIIDEAPFRPPSSVFSKLSTRKPVITIRTYSRQAWAGTKSDQFDDNRRLWITSNEVLVDVKNHLKGKCEIVHLIRHHAHHSTSAFVTLGTHRQVQEDSISERDHCFYSVLPTSKQQSNLCSVPTIDEGWKTNLISKEPEWVKIEDEAQGEAFENYKDLIKNYPWIGKLRHLELFGGIGSMTVGLIELGLASQEETTFIDMSPPACHTLSANFPRSRVICADVNEVLQLMVEGKTKDNRDFLTDLRTGHKVHYHDLPRPGDFDLITAGFPCGSHSTLNVLRKANDPKNALCATTLSFIAHLKPDYIFFENVRGLLKTSFVNPFKNSVLDKAFLRLICGTLITLGYQVRFGVLQAAQFGSPQRRRRIIFSGTRHGLTPISLPEPTHDFPDEKVAIILPTNEDASQSQTQTNPNRLVRADYRKYPAGSLKPTTVKDAISDLPRFEYLNPKRVMKGDSAPPDYFEENLLDHDIDQREIVKHRSSSIPQLDRFISFSSSLNRSRIGLIGFDEFQYITKPRNRYQVWLRKPLEWKPLNDPFVPKESIKSSCRSSAETLSSASANQNISYNIESDSDDNDRIRNWHVTPKFSSQVTERICNIPFKPNADHRSLPKPLRLKNQARFNKFADLDGNYGRLNDNAQFNTIITKMHPQNQNRCGTVLHPHQNRTLTLLEAQRAQGFPDRFKLEPMIRNGKIIDESLSRQLFKMIGNTIPIQISINLAKCLLKSRETDFFSQDSNSPPGIPSSSSSSLKNSSEPILSDPQKKVENHRKGFDYLKTCVDCSDLINLYLDQ